MLLTDAPIARKSGRSWSSAMPARRISPAPPTPCRERRGFRPLFFVRSNPKGIIFERWRHLHGCARFFNAARDTVTDKFIVTYKAGDRESPNYPAANDGGPAAGPTGRRQSSTPSHACRAGAARPAEDASDGRDDAFTPARGGDRPRSLGSLRRQSSEGRIGDTLGASALLANGIHLVGRSFKYHRPRGILSAGGGRAHALVEGRAAARRADANMRATSRSSMTGSPPNPEPLAVAAFDVGAVNGLVAPCLPPASTTRPSCGRRRPGSRSTSPYPLAAGLGMALTSPIPTTMGTAMPIAMCWWWAAARRGWRRRWPRPGRCAGDPRRRAAGSAGRSNSRAAPIDGKPAGWLDGRGAACRHGRCPACSPAPLRSATTHNLVGLAERLTDHLGDPGRTPRASGFGRFAPGRSCWRPAPSSGTWCSPKRPAGHHARRCRAHLPQPLRRRGRPRCGVATNKIPPMARRSICRGRRRGRRDRRPARGGGDGGRLPAPGADRDPPAAVAGHGRQAASLGDDGGAEGRRRPAHDRLRCAARFRRLDADRPPLRAIARQGRLRRA